MQSKIWEYIQLSAAAGMREGQKGLGGCPAATEAKRTPGWPVHAQKLNGLIVFDTYVFGFGEKTHYFLTAFAPHAGIFGSAKRGA